VDIIDVSDRGVRTAVLELRRKGTPCRFTIYPMIHVGEAAFYRDVRARLAGHDLIVAEGRVAPGVLPLSTPRLVGMIGGSGARASELSL